MLSYKYNAVEKMIFHLTTTAALVTHSSYNLATKIHETRPDSGTAGPHDVNHVQIPQLPLFNSLRPGTLIATVRRHQTRPPSRSYDKKKNDRRYLVTAIADDLRVSIW